MKSLVVLIVLAVAAGIVTQNSAAQESLQGKQISSVQNTSFVSTAGDVPGGNSITYALAYPVLGHGVFPVFTRISFGFSSVLQLSYANEGDVANEMGVTNPEDSWGVKLQLSPQRGQYPSIAVYFKGSIGWQNQLLGANDLHDRIPDLFKLGLVYARYQFSSTSVGLGLETQLSEPLTVRFAIGIQEDRSRNLDIFRAPALVPSDRFYDTENYNSLILDGAASVQYVLAPKISLMAEFVSVPYYAINAAKNQLDLRRAFANLVGVKYSLTPILNLDTYIRQQSKINNVAFTQFRLGISGILSIAQ